MSPLYTYSQFINRQSKLRISSIKVFIFQLATGRIESVAYKNLIAPFKNDLPTTDSDAVRRVCADHKYAYLGPKILKTKLSLTFSCQLVPLPETSYEVPWAFIISKNSSYKGLINWRWDNKMKTIRYMTDISCLWVPRKSPNREGHVLFNIGIPRIKEGRAPAVNITVKTSVETLSSLLTANWFEKKCKNFQALWNILT